MQTENGTFAGRTRRVQLHNGLILLIYENHANPTVHFKAAVRAGEFLDPTGKDGLSQLTAAMLKRGTIRHSKIEIAQGLEDVGANLEIHANRFMVSANGQSLSKDLTSLLSTFAEVLREPSFPEAELTKIKHQVIGQLKRQQEQTAVRAYERFFQKIYKPDNPYYQPPVEEHVAAIESISSDDLRWFYDHHYGAKSLILTIVGAVDAVTVEKHVAELLGDWRLGSPPQIEFERTRPGEKTEREIIRMDDKANTDVVIGHAGQLRRIDPDYYAATIANAALGHSTLSSRLGLRVRDREGLTYGIASRFIEAGFGDGPWAVSLTVNPENLEKAVASTLDVIDTYVQEGISAIELEDEKSFYVGSFVVGMDTNGGMAAQLLSAEAFGFGPSHLDQVPTLVKSVTQDQVNESIQRYIHPESFVTVIAGEYHSPDL